MKIGIEASVLHREAKTGVDYYTRNLLEEVVKQMPNDLFYLTYISFIHKKPSDLGIYGKNVIPRKISWFPGRFYHLLVRWFVGIPYDLASMLRPDVFFFPNFVRWPLIWTKASVIVVYDLSYLHAGEHSVRGHRGYLTRTVPKSIRRATQVVTISENSRREILAEYGTNPNKVSVVYPAVNHEFFMPRNAKAIATVQAKYGINQPYILSVGTIEPRKNLVGLLKAYAQLSVQVKKKYALVLTGGKGWLDTEINDLYDSLSQEYTIIRTGYAAEADLPALYSGASVFAYPSFYEGFGMPPLEAMACGTPVIVGDNSSLPEVVGNAGIKVDARDTEAIAAALTKVLSDDKLAQQMSAAGFEQAKKFVWQEEAAKLVDIFKAIGRT